MVVNITPILASNAAAASEGAFRAAADLQRAGLLARSNAAVEAAERHYDRFMRLWAAARGEAA